MYLSPSNVSSTKIHPYNAQLCPAAAEKYLYHKSRTGWSHMAIQAILWYLQRIAEISNTPFSNDCTRVVSNIIR